MTVFILAAALLCATALFLLLRTRKPSAGSGELVRLREQLLQLDALKAGGALDDEAHAKARAGIERRIVDAALDAPAAQATPQPVPSRLLMVGVTLFTVALVSAGYAWLGTPEALDTLGVGPAPGTMRGNASADGGHDIASQQFDGMIARLASRLEQQPGDAEGWAMLARSYAVTGRIAEALPAFKRALALRPGDAELQADFDNARASADARAAAPQGKALSGRVTLSAALAKRAAPGDTLFVYARAADGSRQPLALMRREVKDLPLSFDLDDTQAMTPAARLSGAERVVVVARISKSGEASPRAGDLQGSSSTVAPGATGVSVEINEVVAN